MPDGWRAFCQVLNVTSFVSRCSKNGGSRREGGSQRVQGGLPGAHGVDGAEAHFVVDGQHGRVGVGVAGAQAGDLGLVVAQPLPHLGLEPFGDASAPVGGQHHRAPLPGALGPVPVDEHLGGAGRVGAVGAEGQDHLVVEPAGGPGRDLGVDHGRVHLVVGHVQVVAGGVVHGVGDPHQGVDPLFGAGAGPAGQVQVSGPGPRPALHQGGVHRRQVQVGLHFGVAQLGAQAGPEPVALGGVVVPDGDGRAPVGPGPGQHGGQQGGDGGGVDVVGDDLDLGVLGVVGVVGQLDVADGRGPAAVEGHDAFVAGVVGGVAGQRCPQLGLGGGRKLRVSGPVDPLLEGERGRRIRRPQLPAVYKPHGV